MNFSTEWNYTISMTAFRFPATRFPIFLFLILLFSLLHSSNATASTNHTDILKTKFPQVESLLTTRERILHGPVTALTVLQSQREQEGKSNSRDARDGHGERKGFPVKASNTSSAVSAPTSSDASPRQHSDQVRVRAKRSSGGVAVTSARGEGGDGRVSRCQFVKRPCSDENVYLF